MKSVRWILALIFAIYAGLKLGGMRVDETMFGSLPAWTRWSVIGAELLVAAWLVSGVWPRVSAFAAVTLLSVFMGAIVIELGKAHPKPCGCEGSAAVAEYDPAAIRKTLLRSLAIDVALMAGALGAYWGTPPR